VARNSPCSKKQPGMKRVFSSLFFASMTLLPDSRTQSFGLLLSLMYTDSSSR
jgi:hypothetical protein